MDSFDYIFGLAALAYIVTSTMFAAVRWWHTCPTANKGYAYPDRRMQALLYSCRRAAPPGAAGTYRRHHRSLRLRLAVELL